MLPPSRFRACRAPWVFRAGLYSSLAFAGHHRGFPKRPDAALTCPPHGRRHGGSMSVAFTLPQRLASPRFGGLFAAATFVSASLVFTVEPMIAKMLLPHLGGSPSVWNTSLVFFQAALLTGYAYAHVLQRIGNVRHQIGVHLTCLALAACALPLAVSQGLGDPDPNAPVLWLLAQLALSIGAPFAVLSATAPLVQCWFASATFDPATKQSPDAYPLYAASNLGSLVALLAYPLAIEPFFTLTAQRLGWTVGFFGFVALVLRIALMPRFATLPRPDLARAARADMPTVREKITWVLLAAAPSSLIMGVTTHLTTDIASFPFLWAVPLALYLLTFVLAFRANPPRDRSVILLAQSVTVLLCLCRIPGLPLGFVGQLAVHLANFFLTALICHQALADRRPPVVHLTTFYLCLSLGGVVGGAFSALLAPVLFTTVMEYPLVLVLACLARPWNGLALSKGERVAVAVTAAGVLLQFGVVKIGGPDASSTLLGTISQSVLVLAAGLSLALRDKAVPFAAVLGALWLAFSTLGGAESNLVVKRSFFGLLRVAETVDPVLGPVRLMYHGTTIHGAQSVDLRTACQPLTYYAPATGIGQAVQAVQRAQPRMTAAVVGLGAGALASYIRPGDRMTFFELDPLVAREASDPALFSYLGQCSRFQTETVLGDARITLKTLPDGALDLLVIDAFSSDTVPAHLLTVEAMQGYFSKLKPDGLLLLNVTNRHLELRDTVIAGIEAAGGTALTQRSAADLRSPLIAAPTTTVVASRSQVGLAAFRADSRWSSRDTGATQPWTDDYSNPLGALIAGLKR